MGRPKVAPEGADRTDPARERQRQFHRRKQRAYVMLGQIHQRELADLMERLREWERDDLEGQCDPEA